MRRTVATLVALASLTVAAPSAFAGLPGNSDKSIVPGKSIGGVKVGMTGKDADKIWKGSGCGTFDADNAFCAYEPMPSSANYYNGYVAFQIASFPKIQSVSIAAAYDGNSEARTPYFPAGLRKYKTSDNLGLKSTLDQVKKVYGSKLKKSNDVQSPYSTYDLAGSKGVTTSFNFQQVSGKTLLIGIYIAK